MRPQENAIGGLSPLQRRSFTAFFVANQLVRESIEESLARANVGTLPEYDALHTLMQAPDGVLSMRELSASAALTISGLSRLVDRLEERGFVARCGLDGDRRAVGVRLLESGRQRAEETWAVLSPMLEARFARALSDEEHAELLRLLRKVLEPLVADKGAKTGLPYIQQV